MSKGSKIYNADRIPSTGCIIIPNRLKFNELLHLEQQLFDRDVTWMCEANTADSLDDLITNHLDRNDIKAIAVSQTEDDPEQLAKDLSENIIKKGGVIIFIPGHSIAMHGTVFHAPGETLDFLTSLKLPTVPLCVTKPKENTLAIEGGSGLPSAELSFGNVIDSHHISTAAWQESILIESEASFSRRDFLNGSLAYALLQGLKKHGSSRKIVDGTDDSELTFDKLLGAAIAFSKEIKKSTNKPRVGIILPPGKGGLLANLAVLFANKIPVNLNFTASKDAVQSAMRQADLDRFITADPFVRKVSTFPWPPNRDLIYIERTLPHLKKSIRNWVILTKLLPASLIAKVAGIETKGGDKEAVLLFTSGSSGEPKGVPLSHRNVLANVCQFGTRISLPNNSAVLGSLPLFHSFGCTVTLWFPCIEGINLITYPSPLDTKRLAELIDTHKVYLLLSTPTFLRGFMKRVKPEQLSSVKLCVTGAEKLPESIARAFEDKFGILPQEGYGLTETSPATNVNLPNPTAAENGNLIESSRLGSVGQFIPGMAVKITTIDDDKPLPINTPGIIWLRGANVFPGYLNNDEKTKEVIVDNWFKTGDVGRMDSDGFLYIEGRISRFSKIGGEMVPHESVEDAINKVLGLTEETERRVAVVGIPDEQKGEAIALLSTIHGPTFDQECIDLRYKLLDIGIPSLWCPKRIIPVDEVPVLASGKLDIKACEAIVKSL